MDLLSSNALKDNSNKASPHALPTTPTASKPPPPPAANHHCYGVTVTQPLGGVIEMLRDIVPLRFFAGEEQGRLLVALQHHARELAGDVNQLLTPEQREQRAKLNGQQQREADKAMLANFALDPAGKTLSRLLRDKPAGDKLLAIFRAARMAASGARMPVLSSAAAVLDASTVSNPSLASTAFPRRCKTLATVPLHLGLKFFVFSAREVRTTTPLRSEKCLTIFSQPPHFNTF